MRCAWSRADAAHAHRRLGFGASLGDLNESVERGKEETLAALMARDEHDPVLLRGARPLLAVEKIEPISGLWMALILGNGAPLRERVALMWHDHFATSNDKVKDPRLMHGQVQLFREHGLGDFRELLRKVARDPAMLVWLDGKENRVGRPNENFAREVLELFTLGIGQYTEDDVREVARAFTGWRVERRRFVNDARGHDGGTKHVFGVGGAHDGDAVLELILAHPACPRWIAGRLLAEFVHPDPTESEVDEWSAAFVARDWNVGRTIEALSRSELFLSARARRSRIAAPVELCAWACRLLGASLPPAELDRATSAMGQALFRPPSVEGWRGGRTWVDPGRWLERHNLLVRLANQEGLELAQALGARKSDPVTAVLAALLPDGASEALRAAASRIAREAPDRGRALRDVTTLALTAPEAQLY